MAAVGGILLFTALAASLWLVFADREREGYERDNRIVMLTLAAINVVAAAFIFTSFL